MNNNQITTLFLFVGAGFLIAANEPRDTVNNHLNYARSLGQVDTVTTEIDDNADQCLTSVGGGSTCELFAFGSITVVKPTQRTTCCISQRRTGFAIGVQAAETEGQYAYDINGDADTADAGETGPCAGYTFVAGEAHDMIPVLENLRVKGGSAYIGRYCKKKIPGAGGDKVSVPCASDAECNTMTADASSGSCLEAHTAENQAAEREGSAYFHCSPSEDDTLVTASTER